MIKLKHLLIENDEKTLYKLALYYRDNYMDEECSTDGQCKIETEGIVQFFKEKGIKAKEYHGLYYGADESYPEYDVDDSVYDNDDKPLEGENHWWAVVDNKFIVDVTADQFHPSNPEPYKVIVTSVNDPNYKKR